jgi:perosamine synthetase
LANPDHFYTEFKKTEELEKALCAVIGSRHCIMTVNGNIALILALMAMGVKAGDEVIVPNYTMIASINSVTMVGATPILVDVDPHTLTLSTAIIAAACTPRTKAVMHVSLNNRSQSMEEIEHYCKENNLLLLEDAAQSLGCKTGGQHYGTFGDIGCFSFSTPKIISTGQGGCVVTDSDELAQKMRKIKNFGRTSGGVDVFDSFGINFKFTDVQAVIGLEQLKKLPDRVRRMRQMFDLYHGRLRHITKMIAPQEETWIPWFIDLFTPRREELMSFLAKHHVQTRATYPEINRTPMYLSDAVFPVSHGVSAHGLFLPSHLLLTDRDIHYVCDLIQLFLS